MPGSTQEGHENGADVAAVARNEDSQRFPQVRYMEFQYRREADVPTTNRTFHDPALIPFWHLLLHNITAEGR